MNNLKKLSVAAVGAAFVALGTAGAAQAMTLIGNGGAVTDDAPINFGETIYATVGQTFTVPTNGENVLNNFSFALNDISPIVPVRFSAYVMQWDTSNNRATGNILYTSTVQPNVPSRTTTNQSGYEQFSFNINNGLTLTTGQQYVAFLSVSRFFNDNTAGQLASVGQGAAIADGTFVFRNTGGRTTDSDFINSLTSFSWNSEEEVDAAFTASFSAPTAVPFGFSPGLGILALGACGAVMQMKKKVQAWKVSGSAFSKS